MGENTSTSQVARRMASSAGFADFVQPPGFQKCAVCKGSLNEDQSVMKLRLEPGWKWSECVKPTVGTEWCEQSHMGYVIKGSMCVKMKDGSELTVKPGEAYSIAPGHDGWVVGDEELEAVEFQNLWGKK